MLTRPLCTHSFLLGWVPGKKWSKRKARAPQRLQQSSSLPLYKQQHPSRRGFRSTFHFSKRDDVHFLPPDRCVSLHFPAQQSKSICRAKTNPCTKVYFKKRKSLPKTLADHYVIWELGAIENWRSSDSSPEPNSPGKKVKKPKVANYSIVG